ncbi:MAG: glycosyltransferase family 87 protein [Tepidisphaeraceae bacterium]
MRAMLIRKIFSRPYTLFVALNLIAMLIPHMYRHDEWRDVYLDASRRLASGQEIYRADSAYVYPPFSAILFVPIAPLPDKAAQTIWYAISAGVFALLLKSAWSLSGGQTVDRLDAPKAEHAIALLGGLCALQFAFNAISHLSLDLIIAAMLMAGGLAAIRGRWMRTGIWWGIAAAFKGPPFLFAGYLIWRRRWWSALVMVLVAVGANLLPDLIHRPAAGGLWVTRWFQDYIRPLGHGDQSQGQWYAGISDNQSLAGDIDRWFLTTVSATPGGVNVNWRPHPIGPEPLKHLVLAIDAMVCLLVAAVMRPGRLRPSADPPMPSRSSLEFGLVMLLILLISPMSSRSLFCMMLLPAFCIARSAVYRRDWIAWTSIVLAGLASVLSQNVGFAPTFSHETLWDGFSTLDAMMLFLGCLWLLGSNQQLAPAPSTPSFESPGMAIPGLPPEKA